MTVHGAEWLAPPLFPVIVSVYVPGAVVAVDGPAALCPQPLAAIKPAKTMPTTKIAGRRLRAKNNSVAVSNPSGRAASEVYPARVASEAEVTLVCRVTVVLAGFSPT